MILKRGYHALRYDPEVKAGKEVTKSEHRQEEKKLQNEAKEFDEQVHADHQPQQVSKQRARRVPMARKTAAALLASAASASVTEAAYSRQPALSEKSLAVITTGVDSGDWKFMMVCTILILFATAWMVNSCQRAAPVRVEVRVDVKHAMTQSMVTYSSLRGAANPRFTPIGEQEQGVWRDGVRETGPSKMRGG